MKKIKLKMGVTSIIITAVVLVCVLVLNALVAVISDKFPMKLDLTSDKVYEFSEQTKNMMNSLETEVTAYALIPNGTQGEYIDYIKEYLDKYKSLSNKFKVEYIDPYENPAFMQEYNDGENQADAGSVIIKSGDSFKVVTFNQLYTQNNYTGTVQIDMERKVTNAVMTVCGLSSGKKVCFIEGHSEYQTQNLKAELENDNYETAVINLSVDKIPEGTQVLFSLAPKTDLTADERDIIDKFIDNGGKFVFVAMPGMQPLERFDAYLKEWGLKPNYDYVIETDESHALTSGGGMPVPAAIMGEHAITQKIKDSDSVFASPDTMSVSIVESANSAVVTPLMTSTKKSYGKTNLSSTTINKESGDISGPLNLAAISEKYGENAGAVMFIGSLTAIEANGILTEGTYLNGDFILNATGYLCGGDTDMGIRAKQISAEKMTMTQQQVGTAIILLQYILPLIIVAIGLTVWLKRRYR